MAFKLMTIVQLLGGMKIKLKSSALFGFSSKIQFSHDHEVKNMVRLSDSKLSLMFGLNCSIIQNLTSKSNQYNQ